MRKTSEAGFTLIEMMIVVAIVAALAAIAVPVFTGEEREASADAEVSAMFTELGLREQEYKLENGAYLSTGASDSATYPASPSKTAVSLAGAPTTWTTLRVVAPMNTVKCGYVAIAGAANAAPGAVASGTFGFAAPAQPYYYLLAHCNLDGNASKDGYYFQSSVDSTLRKVNPGF